mmetsp:Transcript_17015/g.22916  ORF Transcript_17015/g.22916 Transcript_17015/m.22916 type:complete len:107 (+) Transcript_17015:22-342(+)
MEAAAAHQDTGRSHKRRRNRKRVSDIDIVIMRVVKEIWSEYDVDNSGSLDKDETKLFVKNTLCEMGDGTGMSDAEFERCFEEFDTDRSGTIEKHEMIHFIKNITGL